MIRRPAFFLALLSALTLFGSHARAAEPYVIYGETSQTGQGAFVGKAQTLSFKAAEDYINKTGGIHGRPVHFVVQDDQTNPQVAVQIFNELVAKNVPVILGPGFSAPCYAVWPLVKTQIVNYCLAPSLHPEAGSFSFSASVSTKDLALAGIRYFHAKGWNKIAVLDTTDATGQDGDNIIKENLALPAFKDMQVVDVEHFAPSDVGIAAQIARIKASGAQAIISWVTGTPFATVCRGIVDSGLDIPILTNAGNISSPQMAQYKDFIPKQLFFTGYVWLDRTAPVPSAVKKVQADFFDAFAAQGIKPDTLDSTAWDTIRVVVDALRHLPDNPTAQQVHDYIEKLHDFPGINGMMDFRDGSQRGVDANAAVVVRYDIPTGDWITVTKPGGLPR